MNVAPGLPLTIGLMGELVESKELECKVAAEGFRGACFGPLYQGVGCLVIGLSVLLRVYGGGGGCRGWQCCRVG